jgi:hypothetical protein
VRKVLIGIAAAFTLSLTPIVVGAPPALASVHVCTAFGNQWCVGATSLAAGTPITNSSPGRDIILQDQHFTHLGLEVYRLVFALDTSKCVGFSANGLAEVRDCSGNSNFTNWMNDGANGNTIWLNNSFDAANCSNGLLNDQGLALTSDNHLGDRLYCSIGNTSGDFLRWTPEPSP